MKKMSVLTVSLLLVETMVSSVTFANPNVVQGAGNFTSGKKLLQMCDCPANDCSVCSCPSVDCPSPDCSGDYSSGYSAGQSYGQSLCSSDVLNLQNQLNQLKSASSQQTNAFNVFMDHAHTLCNAATTGAPDTFAAARQTVTAQVNGNLTQANSTQVLDQVITAKNGGATYVYGSFQDYANSNTTGAQELQTIKANCLEMFPAATPAPAPVKSAAYSVGPGVYGALAYATPTSTQALTLAAIYGAYYAKPIVNKLASACQAVFSATAGKVVSKLSAKEINAIEAPVVQACAVAKSSSDNVANGSVQSTSATSKLGQNSVSGSSQATLTSIGTASRAN